MESKWLEDFILLAETGSFSRAAEMRHVTQPAFSRRIKALERWLGVDLVDRSEYPMRLTEAGKKFRADALAMTSHLRDVRESLNRRAHEPRFVSFALTHNLSLTFFPRWLRSMIASIGPMRSKVRAENVHDALARLPDGSCDIAMCYHHPRRPIDLDPALYDTTVLGVEYIRPYGPRAEDSVADFGWPGSVENPVPLLSYSPDSYLSRVTQIMISRLSPAVQWDVVYEADMAENLKAMVLAGHGVAFLPESTVSEDTHSGALGPIGGEREPIEIRAFRSKRLAGTEAGRPSERLWSAMVSAGPRPVATR
jgi:DNA-binding transcriptional LysR family regulator